MDFQQENLKISRKL